MATVNAPDRLFTVDEYFEIEVNTDVRNVFNRGRVSVMTGGSDNHIDICWNLIGLLHKFLQGKPCRGYGESMRVEAVPGEYYTYPDISIACPPIKKRKIRGTATLCNPVAIIEVLSPSTEALDRDEKFNEYIKIPSLKEYFLVSQHKAQVERWSRSDGNQWTISVVAGLSGTLRIDSIDCSLPMTEIYEEVELPSDEDSEATA